MIEVTMLLEAGKDAMTPRKLKSTLSKTLRFDSPDHDELSPAKALSDGLWHFGLI